MMCSLTWKVSATPRGRLLFRLLPSVLPIDETDSGSLLPTPTASNTKAVHLRTNGRPPRSYLPTPTVKGDYNRAGLSAKSGDGLATQVGGALNPTWVEWLMGFPAEWTALDASEMPSSRRSSKRSAEPSCSANS
jgi:hypothetical protein